jgi:hypothetical protein
MLVTPFITLAVMLKNTFPTFPQLNLLYKNSHLFFCTPMIPPLDETRTDATQIIVIHMLCHRDNKSNRSSPCMAFNLKLPNASGFFHGHHESIAQDEPAACGCA